MKRFSLDLVKYSTRQGWTLDARGLMPLEAARSLLENAKVYERDTADALWVALLSLDTGEEFVRHATRLDWKFPMLRGWDNEDAVTRYGVGCLPWLETLLDRIKGKVGSIPAMPFAFVSSHLLALGGEALVPVLRVRRTSDPDPDQLGFVRDWLERQGTSAWKALGAAAHAGLPEAKRALDTLLKRNARATTAALKKAGLTAKAPKVALTAAEVLRVLDAAASAQLGERLPWPSLHPTAGHFEPHALRVITAREEKGDGWGILIEVVQGDLLDTKAEWPAVVQQYTYGSKVPSGGRYLVDSRPLKVSAKKMKVTPAQVAKLALQPGWSVTGAVERWPDVLAIRAALELHEEAVFPAAEKAFKTLKLTRAKVVNVSTAWEHVDGTALGKGDWAKLPSQSIAWRTLALALERRDGALFEAGEPNTSWRQLAKTQQP